MEMKKNSKWTEEQIDELRKLYVTGESLKKIAKHFGRSVKSIERTLHRNQIVRPATEETSIQQDLGEAANLYWQARYKELTRKYDKLVDQRTVVDVLAHNILEIAPRSYDPAPNQYNQHPDATGDAQEAVLHLSDSHIGQVIHKTQTLNFGSYDFAKFMDRARYIERQTVSICTEHVNTKLPVLNVCLGGDLLHGDLNHANEAAHVMPLFTQYYAGGHILAQLLRNLAPHFKLVKVRGVVGNHTRWGTQRKMPTVNRFSNLDMFVMTLMEALTRDIKNIEWDLTTEPFAEFEIMGWTHRLEHGDHLRGGDRALGIPAHAFGRELSAISQLYAKHEKNPVNYFLVGHMHRPMELPHANGQILVNGGWPGLDEFALTNNFNPVSPQQRLYLVHPRYGKTANYHLTLADAKDGEGAEHYTHNDLIERLLS